MIGDKMDKILVTQYFVINFTYHDSVFDDTEEWMFIVT